MEDARGQVDEYCDVYAKHVFTYLTTEFNIFRPKVFAFMCAIVGLGIFWTA